MAVSLRVGSIAKILSRSKEVFELEECRRATCLNYPEHRLGSICPLLDYIALPDLRGSKRS